VRRRGSVALVVAGAALAACAGPAADPGREPTTATGVTSPSAQPSSATTRSPSSASPTGSSSASASPTTLDGCLDLTTWPAARVAAQTLMAPVTMTSLSDASGPVAQGVGGLLLFGPRAPADLGRRLDRLTAGTAIAPIVASDEEGGSVQRLETIVGELPSARRMAATLAPAQIRSLAREAGTAMVGAGVGMDLAPVLDLDDRPGPSPSNPDGTRSFSLDPAVASAAGLAFAAGLQDAGVVPVVKHFPGLGYSTGNTDDRPAATKSWTELQRTDLLPFQDAVAAGIPAVMVANATVPGLTDEPASLSRVVIEQELRDRLGFEGLVVTDSLSAEAIRAAGYGVPSAAVAALRAGADLVLYGGGGSSDPALTTRTVTAITAAMESGRLDRARVEEAAGRVLAVKGVTACAAPTNR
jgi:beta-N-acetylhexosaminidase